ncbi:hypothetical protein AXK56_10495 [Tsukamurella pulmonis]|uniref:Uncharacterized protein n=1 Tax=Tsukamurella pulmonis TaxID=47312 RepID=A0A1H1FDT2_9ACTN|nr:hypothetical protein [Tsukamurella pulmonis]KXO88738.1 hypothetical protein AXK56_10495 [Tsukamurella pulmonis]SDQ99107.1 hypothetical protein SAMN04489765_2661 [Tsukamurella pulmonis]SUP19614.1 Uncharacterised protein [Tsukamurella pulmonis]
MTTTSSTTAQTGDLDTADIAAAFDPCPECTTRTYEALRSAILAMPVGEPVRWSALRRRLPKDSAKGLEAASALLKLCDQGEAVLVSGRDATWVARADDFDKATAQLTRPGGKTANTFDYR